MQEEYNLSALPTTELKHMISALSYQRDDILLAKGLNPHQLRAKFYKLRQNKQPFLLTDVDDFGENSNQLYKQYIKDWATQQTSLPLEDLIIIRTNSYEEDDGEFFAQNDQTDTYHVIYLDITGRLNLISCSITVDSDPAIWNEAYLIEKPVTVAPAYTMEEIIREYDLLIEILGEQYSYKTLITSIQK